MSENRESISDKLRRWADESDMEHSYPSIIAGRELGFGDCVTTKEERALFHHIADEIDREMDELCEQFSDSPLISPMQAVSDIAKGKDKHPLLKEAIDRYYLPRPLFDDGEPAQFGDRFVNDKGNDSTLSSLNYTKGAHGYVSANGGQRHEVTNRFRRPAQPVLDADGVPIEVGDTVWTINVPKGHDKCTVKGFKTFEEMGITDVPSTHAVLFEESGWMGNLRVTHREPDTQERIDEDATMPPREYYAKYIGHDVGLKDDEEAWTAVTAHLLRRQREVKPTDREVIAAQKAHDRWIEEHDAS